MCVTFQFRDIKKLTEAVNLQTDLIDTRQFACSTGMSFIVKGEYLKEFMFDIIVGLCNDVVHLTVLEDVLKNLLRKLGLLTCIKFLPR